MWTKIKLYKLKKIHLFNLIYTLDPDIRGYRLT